MKLTWLEAYNNWSSKTWCMENPSNIISSKGTDEEGFMVYLYKKW